MKNGDAKSKKKAKAHTRYYDENGNQVVGITTILGVLNKPALVGWANRLGLDGVDVKGFVSELASIGTLGHQLITNGLIGEPTDTSDFTTNQIERADWCVKSFNQWKERNPISEVYWVEKPLVSNTHRFGGTADIHCKLGLQGVNAVVEIKTGSGIYPEHLYQAATQKRLMEENGYQVDVAYVLNVPRSEDEAFAEHILTPKELEVGWQVFWHCLQIYNLKKKGK